MITQVYRIGGMACAACSASIERKTKSLNGVAEVSVNLTTEKMTITYDESLLSSDEIIKAVESLDFAITPFDNKERTIKVKDEAEEKDEKLGLILSLICAALLLLISMGHLIDNPYGFAISQLVLALIVLILGRKKILSGIKSLFHLAPNMDTLVAVSCLCAFIYSVVMTVGLKDNPHNINNLYFESCGVVLAFISLGKYLEARSKEKTKDAIKGLLSLAPLTAIRVENGRQEEVDASELKVGDTILVLQGARVPADGIVSSGSCDIDESAFTGESLPIHKEVGSNVICGSVNVNGSIYIQVEKVGEDTTLAGIIKFVEDAQGRKAPIQNLADKVAGIFVPVVMSLASIAGIIWLALGYEFAFALKVFTCVLVIACPCALGLATPTAIICGTGLGAQNGILIRSGAALENAKNANVVVLDKTGTLTKGKPVVSDIYTVDGFAKEELVALTAEVESFSKHPLAGAVVSYAKKENLNTDAKVDRFDDVPGKGMIAKLKDGRILYCGNAALLSDNDVDYSDAESFAKERSKEGKSNIFVALEEKLIGVIALSDELKEYSIKLIEELHQMDLKTVLLTGDNKEAANYIGGKLGVDEVIAQVLPKDKAMVIEKIKAEGNVVMMVGDGVNDAPALVTADVGCAIGSGSDIAIDSADIVLMKDNPLDVAKAIKLSRLTIRNIKQNLFWAFFYNCMGIPIAAGVLYPAFNVLLSPMIGGLAMSFSSVFVVSNALRLKTKKL